MITCENQVITCEIYVITCKNNLHLRFIICVFIALDVVLTTSSKILVSDVSVCKSFISLGTENNNIMTWDKLTGRYCSGVELKCAKLGCLTTVPLFVDRARFKPVFHFRISLPLKKNFTTEKF